MEKLRVKHLPAKYYWDKSTSKYYVMRCIHSETYLRLIYSICKHHEALKCENRCEEADAVRAQLLKEADIQLIVNKKTGRTIPEFNWGPYNVLPFWEKVLADYGIKSN